MGGFGHHLVVKGMELESVNTERERERADRAEALAKEQEEEINRLREEIRRLSANTGDAEKGDE